MLERAERLLASIETSLLRASISAGLARRRVAKYHGERHKLSTAWEDFFTQPLDLENYIDRLDLFRELCSNRRVLHVGCVDWPIFDPKRNLHLQLSAFAGELTGLDNNEAGLDVLKKHCHGAYFKSTSEVSGTFDVVLVPEVIEHVPNVKSFLDELDTLSFERIVFTVPNAFMPPPGRLWNGSHPRKGGMVEVVHPDHKCWYSPYTLKNTIASFTPWKITRLGLNNAYHSVFIEALK